MSLMESFLSKKFESKARIGIGLGNDTQQNSLIIKVITKFLKENYKTTVFLFLKHENEIVLSHSQVKIIKSKDVELDIFKYLTQNKIDSIIRGSLSSDKFISQVKANFAVNKVYRLALLETSRRFRFFFAPVGIDECNYFGDKKTHIQKAINFMNSIDITPKVSILSGGRRGDKGRDQEVDATLKEADKIVDFFRDQYPNIIINHDQILIENAVKKRCNLIIAPNGIAGNLIYRTLVHLGGGKAYGAIYLGLEKLVFDTSRVGKMSEIEGAILITHYLV